jgi:hypothetical protein
VLKQNIENTRGNITSISEKALIDTKHGENMKCPFDVTPIVSQNSTILPHTITRAQHWPSAGNPRSIMED